MCRGIYLPAAQRHDNIVRAIFSTLYRIAMNNTSSNISFIFFSIIILMIHLIFWNSDRPLWVPAYERQRGSIEKAIISNKKST